MTLQGLEIRAAIAEGLRSLEGAAWAGRVFKSRRRPIADAEQGEEFPLVLVYSRSEKTEPFNVAPRSYLVTMRVETSLVIERLAELNGVEETDDDLDKIAGALKRWFFQDASLGGIAEDSRWISGQYEAPNEGQDDIAVLTLTWEVDYILEAPEEPEEGLPNLATLATDYDLAPPNGTIDAHDEVALPTQ